ncbi:YbdD/YjiX family protein [Pseudolysobacter antarcticus]|uniref:YbdD/YjiX family protein n=1 Tax=Pseudolysobacter antarcticus TaxID=2511995 RepID=A0A411HGX9_9GAMM|nr:YbdD/YjiX family protein [Pseudolysobacter antarcticus]QBB69796.1 YbdD/YjiX family protein [Pseudolysobacter antarcticus]
MPIDTDIVTPFPAPALRGWRAHLRHAWRKAVQVARLCIGVPDYDVYVAHRRLNHPHEPVMTYPEFFNERQAARYGKGRSRCC